MSVHPTRVALCDDDPLVRRALTAFLTSSDTIELVGTASCGSEAIALVDEHDPDVLVLDVHMPDMEGTAVASALHRRRARCRVLYLTSFPQRDLGDDVLSGLAAGALSKDLDRDSFLRAVHSIAQGLTLLEDATIPAPRTTAPEPARPATTNLARTPAEKQVLRLLCQGAPNAEIARQLNFSESWVKATLRVLMKRSGVNNRVELVLAALGGSPGDHG